MVRPERFELPTLWFVAKYSIQLSYGRTLSTSSYYQTFLFTGICERYKPMLLVAWFTDA